MVALTCFAAVLAAQRARQPAEHARTWLLIALLFGVLIIWRGFAAEEWFRALMREYLRETATYDDRRSVQAPIIAVVIVAAGMGGLLFLYRWGRLVRGRRNYARLVAVLAAVAMLLLIALRLASLHVVDGILFGALKLNWVIDIGTSFLVLASAIAYFRIVRSKSPGNPK